MVGKSVIELSKANEFLNAQEQKIVSMGRFAKIFIAEVVLALIFGVIIWLRDLVAEILPGKVFIAFIWIILATLLLFGIWFRELE